MVIDIGPNLTSVLIAFVSALAAVLAAYFARKASVTAATTHDLVNSRMTELLAATKSSSRAEGVTAGIASTVPAAGSTPQEVVVTQPANDPIPVTTIKS